MLDMETISEASLVEESQHLDMERQTTMTSPHFQFLAAAEEETLMAALRNNLRLGQWEQARAILHTIAKSGASGAAVAKSILAAVVCNPRVIGSITTGSVPSHHHLAWLCIMEHGDLFAATGDNALWPHVVQHIEFRVTLEECVSKDPSSEPDQSTRAIEELCTYHRNRVHYATAKGTVPPPEILSEAGVALLQRVLLFDPVAGQTLATFLVGATFSAPSSRNGVIPTDQSIRSPSYYGTSVAGTDSSGLDGIDDAMRNRVLAMQLSLIHSFFGSNRGHTAEIGGSSNCASDTAQDAITSGGVAPGITPSGVSPAAAPTPHCSASVDERAFQLLAGLPVATRDGNALWVADLVTTLAHYLASAATWAEDSLTGNGAVVQDGTRAELSPQPPSNDRASGPSSSIKRRGRVLSCLLAHGAPYVVLCALNRHEGVAAGAGAGADDIGAGHGARGSNSAFLHMLQEENFWGQAFSSTIVSSAPSAHRMHSSAGCGAVAAGTRRPSVLLPPSTSPEAHAQLHVVQRIIETILELIRQRDFTTLAHVVAVPAVAPLRGIFPVLGWTLCLSDPAAGAALLNLAPQPRPVSVLADGAADGIADGTTDGTMVGALADGNNVSADATGVERGTSVAEQPVPDASDDARAGRTENDGTHDSSSPPLRAASDQHGAEDTIANNVSATIAAKLSYHLQLAQAWSDGAADGSTARSDDANSASALLSALLQDMVEAPHACNTLGIVSQHMNLRRVDGASADGQNTLVALLTRQPVFNSAAAIEKENDLTVLQSFLAIRHILDVLDRASASSGRSPRRRHSTSARDVTTPAGNDASALHAELAADIAKAKQLVDAIVPVTYRVEILENMFCLLFLQRRDASRSGNTPDVSGSPDVGRVHDAVHQGAFVASVDVVDQILRFLRDSIGKVHADVSRRDAVPDGDRTPVVAAGEMGGGGNDGEGGVVAGAQKHMAVSARPVPTSVSRVALHARVARLEQYVNEAAWRHRLITGNQRIGSALPQPLTASAPEDQEDSLEDTDLTRGRTVSGAPSAVETPDIVQRMLASPDTLLTTCLQARDFARAQEVIQMFNIDNDTSKDARFAQQLSDIATALARGEDVAAAIHELSDTMERLAAIHICVDLAITAACKQEDCAWLLDKAAAAVESDDSGAMVIKSMLPFVLKLKNSMQVVGAPLNALVNDRNRPMDTETLKASLQDEHDTDAALTTLHAAVHATAPAGDVRAMRSPTLTQRAQHVATLRTMKTTAVHAMAAVKQAFSITRTSPQAPGAVDVPAGVGAGAGVTASVARWESYLDKLFVQLEILEDAANVVAAGDGRDVGNSESLNALRHLQEEPVSVLARLVLQEGLDVAVAADIASKLHLNLTHILIRSSCAPLCIAPAPADSVDVATPGLSRALTGEQTSDGLMALPPLNQTGHAHAAHSTLNTDACVLTHDILQGFCTMLAPYRQDNQYVPLNPATLRKVRASQAYVSLTTSVAELDGIDYGALTDVQRLCVYANIVNIMRLHGCIARGPPQAAAEWVAWCSSVVYALGSLGVVSAFALEFCYLRAAMPIPRQFDGALKYFVTPIAYDSPQAKLVVGITEPSMQFGIWAGHAFSPSPIPLLPATYQSVLQSAKTLYLLQYIEVKKGGTVVLPRFVEWYAQDFLVGPEADTPSAVLGYVATNLPAGSATHAYVTNAGSAEVAYGQFSFAPLCRLIEVNAVDPRHVSSFNAPAALLDHMLCDDRTGNANARYPLTPNATRYLQDHSQVVKSLAVLVSVGTDMTGPSGVNTSGGQQDAYNMQYTARLNAHTAACQPLGNLVEFRLRKIVGLPQFNRLSARLITAFLLNTDPVLRHRACCSIIDELMIAKQYRACVDLIDSGLFLHTHVSLDFLFCAAFCRAAYDSESWRFVVRLRNVCLATRLTLDYLSAWNVDVAVDMLKLCSHHLKSRHDVTNTTTPRASVTPPPSAGDASAPDLRHQVTQQLARLEVYAEILQHHPQLGTWQEVMRQSEENPTTVVRHLIDSQHFDLSRRWATLHGVEENEIEQNYLLMLLDMEETLQAHQVLNSIPDRGTLKRVCFFLVQKCKHLRSVVFVVRFMVQTISAELSAVEIAELGRTEIGATMLALLPPTLQTSLRSLVSTPARLFEHLLMNKQVQFAKLALSAMEPREVETILAVETFEAVTPSTVEQQPVDNQASGVARDDGEGRVRQVQHMEAQSASGGESPGVLRRLVGAVAWFRHDILSFYAEQALAVQPDSLGDANGANNGANGATNGTSGTDGGASGSTRRRAGTSMGRTAKRVRSNPSMRRASKPADVAPTVELKYWEAAADATAQRLLRKKFYYTQAPSATLAMAILELYQNPMRCGDTCLYLCSKLSDQLASNPRAYDHYFMINSIRRLLYTAKLKFLDSGATSKISLCDAYLSHADLLRVLLSSRCSYVLSITDLSKPEKARRLRDKLIEDDKMDLAVQVATKCNLDSFDVWSSWGRSKLELGLYDEARSKFERCLQRGGSNDPRQKRLLDAITEMLEAAPCPSLPDIQHMQAELHAAIKAATTGDERGRLTSHAHRHAALFGSDGDGSGGHSGGGDMSGGHPSGVKRVAFLPPLIAVTTVNQGRVHESSCLNSERFHEAVWYLERFGTSDMLCDFYINNGFVEQPCRYVVDHNVLPKVFLESIFKPQQAADKLDALLDVLALIDQSLDKWAPHLIVVCRYLTKCKMLHTLYKVQVFMKDFFRAGITSVKFACAANLFVPARLEFLVQARGHFAMANVSGTDSTAEHPSTETPTTPTAALPPKDAEEIQRYLQSVEFQIDIVRFFSKQAADADGNGDTGRAAHLLSMCQLSLFGRDEEKERLCAEVLDTALDVAGDASTGLVSDLINFYNLSLVSILQTVAPRIAAKGNPDATETFLEFIKDRLEETEWDSILRVLVDTYFKLDEGKAADKLVQRMKNDKAKIAAFIACNKLKAAYLVAVRAKYIDEIRHIHQLAIESGNNGVVNICDAFFKTQTQ